MADDNICLNVFRKSNLFLYISSFFHMNQMEAVSREFRSRTKKGVLLAYFLASPTGWNHELSDEIHSLNSFKSFFRLTSLPPSIRSIPLSSKEKIIYLEDMLRNYINLNEMKIFDCDKWRVALKDSVSFVRRDQFTMLKSIWVTSGKGTLPTSLSFRLNDEARISTHFLCALLKFMNDKTLENLIALSKLTEFKSMQHFCLSRQDSKMLPRNRLNGRFFIELVFECLQIKALHVPILHLNSLTPFLQWKNLTELRIEVFELNPDLDCNFRELSNLEILNLGFHRIFPINICNPTLKEIFLTLECSAGEQSVKIHDCCISLQKIDLRATRPTSFLVELPQQCPYLHTLFLLQCKVNDLFTEVLATYFNLRHLMLDVNLAGKFIVPDELRSLIEIYIINNNMDTICFPVKMDKLCGLYLSGHNWERLASLEEAPNLLILLFQNIRLFRAQVFFHFRWPNVFRLEIEKSGTDECFVVPDFFPSLSHVRIIECNTLYVFIPLPWRKGVTRIDIENCRSLKTVSAYSYGNYFDVNIYEGKEKFRIYNEKPRHPTDMNQGSARYSNDEEKFPQKRPNAAMKREDVYPEIVSILFQRMRFDECLPPPPPPSTSNCVIL